MPLLQTCLPQKKLLGWVDANWEQDENWELDEYWELDLDDELYENGHLHENGELDEKGGPDNNWELYENGELDKNVIQNKKKNIHIICFITGSTISNCSGVTAP